MIVTDVMQHIMLVVLGVACGAVLGFLFDIYRVLRGRFHPGKLLTALGDLLFWVFGALVVMLMLFSQSWVEMRFYIAICIMAGVFVYRKTASRFVVGIMAFLSRLLEKAISAFVHLALIPLLKILSWPVRGIYGIAKKLVKK